MAKKVKDLLKILEKQVHSDELTALIAASSLDDVDITDEGWEEMTTGIMSLMSKKAAANNPDIINEILEDSKGEIIQKTLFSIEKRLKSLASKTGIDLGDAKKAHEMLNIFDDKVDAFEGGDEKTKSLIESYKSDLDKRNAEILALNEQHQTEVETLQEDFRKREVKTQFELQAKGQPWAEHYTIPAVNKALTDQIWNDANSQAILKYKDGVIKPFNKEHPEKPLYLNNKEATFEDLVDPKYEPYLKKSEKPSTPQHVTQAPSNGEMTAAERNRAAMETAHGHG